MTNRPGISVATSGGRGMFPDNFTPEKLAECCALVRAELTKAPATTDRLKETTGCGHAYVVRALRTIGAKQDSSHYPRLWSV